MDLRRPSPAARLALWAAAFVVAGYAGRMTIIDGQALSLVWPAAGVGALWLCSSDRRTRVWDSVGLGSCTLLVNFTTGASAQLALVFVVVNLVQAWIFVSIARRLMPHVRGVAPRGIGTTLRPVGQVSDLGSLVFAAITACTVAAGLGMAGMWWAAGGGDLVTFLLWWGRNTAGVLVVVSFGLLLVARLADVPGRTVRHRLRATLRAAWLDHGRENLAIYGLTVLAVVGVFVLGGNQPLSFVLLFPTLLAGARLSALSALWHSILMGGVMVGFTLHRIGPLGPVESIEVRALLAQGFVSLVVVAGLVLAFSHAERDVALARLARSERAAEDRAALLTAVMETMRDGLVVVQQDGTVVLRNDASKQLLDRPPSDVVLGAASYGFHDAQGRLLTDEQLPYHRALTGEDVHGEDLFLGGADGHRRIVEVDALRLPGLAEGEQDRAVVSFRDVTAARTERDNLAAFAGVVAHDLLNPLTVIRGWADSLDDAFRDGPVRPSDGRAMVDRINTAAAHMGQFIDDLLDYTVARDRALNRTPIDLSALAEEVAAMRREGATRPVIRVQADIAAYGDPALVRQLLDNLIGNAVKYVAPGVRPVVEVSARQQDGVLEVVVSDNGIGVPVAARDSIFESFQRAHVEDYRGTGIGLAICRQVVQRHGGSIRVEDRDDAPGSRFTFSLPLAG